MDYFLISLKPLLFTGWAHVGTMLPLDYCWGPWLLRNFPWTHAFLRVGGQCVFWKGLLSSENFPDLCLKKAEPCQYLLGDLTGLAPRGVPEPERCEEQAQGMGLQVLYMLLQSEPFCSELFHHWSSFEKKDPVPKYFRNHSHTSRCSQIWNISWGS